VSARWIKLYAGIKNSAVWSDPLRLKAWIDILISANYRDKEWFQHGEVVKVQRGQFVTSIRSLSKSWKCSRDTVRRILKQFDDLGMIRHEVRPGKYTLITVVKYEVFQDCKLGESYTDKDTDEYTDKDTDEYTDKDTDTTQHKNIYIRNTEQEKEIESLASWDAADGHGEAPEGWTAEIENDFQKLLPQNPRMTREYWWKYLTE